MRIKFKSEGSDMFEETLLEKIAMKCLYVMIIVLTLGVVFLVTGTLISLLIKLLLGGF